jgi:hypothetical protein
MGCWQSSYSQLGEQKSAASFDGEWIWVGCCCPNGQRTVDVGRSLGDLAVLALGDLGASF